MRLKWKEFQRIVGHRNIVGTPIYFSISPKGKMMFYPGLPPME